MDWRKRYEELAALVAGHERLMQEISSRVALSSRRLANHVKETDRLRLREENKVRLLRLTRDYTVEVQYTTGVRPRPLPAGTLIEAEPHAVAAYVYLDEDGDGNMYFPVDTWEVVELNRDEVDWKNVITQG